MKEGEEFSLDTNEQILRFECCDCGLTHDFKFGIKNRQEIKIIIKRNNYSTGQKRRKDEKGTNEKL
ncbi:hypothetical protein ES705_33698 [subsurface metagenome]